MELIDPKVCRRCHRQTSGTANYCHLCGTPMKISGVSWGALLASALVMCLCCLGAFFGACNMMLDSHDAMMSAPGGFFIWLLSLMALMGIARGLRS